MQGERARGGFIKQEQTREFQVHRQLSGFEWARGGVEWAGCQEPKMDRSPETRWKSKSSQARRQVPRTRMGIQMLGCMERGAGQQREVKVLGKVQQKHDMDDVYGSLEKNLSGPHVTTPACWRFSFGAYHMFHT